MANRERVYVTHPGVEGGAWVQRTALKHMDGWVVSEPPKPKPRKPRKGQTSVVELRVVDRKKQQQAPQSSDAAVSVEPVRSRKPRASSKSDKEN